MAPGFHRDGHGTRANPEFYHTVPVSSRPCRLFLSSRVASLPFARLGRPLQ